MTILTYKQNRPVKLSDVARQALLSLHIGNPNNGYSTAGIGFIGQQGTVLARKGLANNLGMVKRYDGQWRNCFQITALGRKEARKFYVEKR